MAEQEVWTEHLVEKHECLPYEPRHLRVRELVLGERTERLVVPSWLPDVEPLRVTFDDDLIFVVGQIRAPRDRALDGEGAMMIGRRREDGAFEVHVWHVMYRFALGHLGLVEPTR